jgi:predicted amidohydrolase
VTQQASVVNGAATRLRVAALQTTPTRGNISQNLEQIASLTAAVPEAQLIITPEMSVSGFSFRPDQVPRPIDVDDNRLSRLANPGQTIGLGIVEANSGLRPYNSFVHIGAAGCVKRKLHLVSYEPWNEQECYTEGVDLVQGNLQGVRVATLICNDAWHPVMPWLAAHAGAEVLIIPAASLGHRTEDESAQTWLAILAHAARTLQCYVIFANRAGFEDGKPFWGGSRIIGPRGEVMAQADDKLGIISADLDIAYLRQLRQDVPLLREVRVDLVSRHVRQLSVRRPLV